MQLHVTEWVWDFKTTRMFTFPPLLSQVSDLKVANRETRLYQSTTKAQLYLKSKTCHTF